MYNVPVFSVVFTQYAYWLVDTEWFIETVDNKKNLLSQ